MPIFVASTFRDMDRERDLLARVVIPRVNERLRERGYGVSIYPVDLRWGVETDGLDAGTRQRVTLQVCASEVRRCRPLFLGLLGGEYGWVPPDRIGTEARVAAGVPDPGFPLSVTALEILSAVAQSLDDGVAPLLLRRVGAEEVAAQTRFREFLGDLPISYDERTFTETAIAELLRLLDSVLTPSAPGDWLAAEVRAHRWAAEQDAQQFVGRESELGAISGFWDYVHPEALHGDEPGHPLHRLREQFGHTALALVGASGCGKSALMAMAATRLDFKGQHEPVRAFVRVGATAASRGVAVCVLVLLAQLDPAAAQTIAREHTPQSLTLDDVLEPWLAVLRGGRRWSGPVIIVDGVDRFSGSLTESQPLSWLPIDLGDRARVLLCTAEDSFEADLLRLRPDTKVMSVHELGLKDAKALVAKRIAGHHKTVAPALVRRLVERSTTARWLVVASELLATLMAHDYLVLRDLGRNADPEVALRMLLEAVVEELPADLGDLHETAMRRLVDLVDVRLGVLLRTVGVAMLGVTEEDLRAVVTEVGLPAVSDAEMALFRDVLSVFVTIQDDRWTFVHDSAGLGVDRLLGTDEDRYRDLFVERLLRRPMGDVSRTQELLPQLLITGALPLLAALLADPRRTGDDAVRGFCSILTGFARDDDPLDIVGPLVDAAADDRERLTAVNILVSHVLPMAARDVAARVATVCRAAIASVDPATVSRFGNTAADLAVLIDTLTFDPFAPGAEPDADGAWLDTVLRQGTGALAHAPAVPADTADMRQRMRLVTGPGALIEYAVAVCAGMVRSAPDDAEQAFSRLARWRALLPVTRWPDEVARRFAELQLTVTERAFRLAWPDHGFTADDTDFAQIRALVDSYRGNPSIVTLFGNAARVRALSCLDEMAEDDWPLLQHAMRFLDEAIWELDLQRFLTPDAILVEVRMVQCRLLSMTLLIACGQLGSACTAGLPVLTAPHARPRDRPARLRGAVDAMAELVVRSARRRRPAPRDRPFRHRARPPPGGPGRRRPVDLRVHAPLLLAPHRSAPRPLRPRRSHDRTPRRARAVRRGRGTGGRAVPWPRPGSGGGDGSRDRRGGTAA